MTIIKIIIRKMLSNRWLTGSLFLGLLITVSLVSSIPTYTSSVLHKLLVSELEDYQIKQGQFPGEFSFLTNFSESTDVDSLKKIGEINDGMISDVGLPALAKTLILSTHPYEIKLGENSDQPFGRMVSMTNIENHITITDGEFPQSSKDDIIQVLVPEKALQKRGIVLNSQLTLKDGEETLTIQPVGTFRAKETNDPYWSIPPERYTDDFIVVEELFQQLFLKDGVLASARFYTAFDYHLIQEKQSQKLLNLENRLKSEVSEVNKEPIIIQFPIHDLLVSYLSKGKQLTIMFWSLNIPVIIMLGLYLFMVSRLIVERQLTEIAVLSSRGAKRSQIMMIYFIEVSILGMVAVVIGPMIGFAFCKFLGATNGFLEFVQREPLQVAVTMKSYLYGICAILVSMVMVMLPVYQASKKSIVHHKQTLTKAMVAHEWYSLLVAVLFLIFSIYGLFVFKNRQPAAHGEELFVDPILFFIPALFIIGVALLFLQIYPLLLKTLYRIGEKYWSLSLFSTFIQVSRSSRQYQFLMLFLMMTIGIGIFSASSARTLNLNLEQQIRYKNGADLVLDVKWESTSIQSLPVSGSTTPATSETEENAVTEKDVVYSEPPFDPFLKLEEVEHAAKVLQKDDITVEAKGKSLFSMKLMGIEPNEFGQTAWFKSSLLPSHWYGYLNLLAAEPSSVLISSKIADSLDVTTGDYLTLKDSSSNSMEVVIYEIMDYWPTFNPSLKNEDGGEAGLIVANLPYVQNRMSLEPYQVWLKVKEEKSRATLYESVKKAEIPVINISDIHPKLVELKNSAFLLGLNGTLSLGFLISVGIAFVGFLLYWILTIQARTLQYGIYRAMGVPLRKLIAILVYEQLFTSGVAAVLGLIIGGITSILYVPLFQISFDPQQMVPPFQVIFDPSDERKIYVFVTLMLVIGLTIFILFLKKLNIHQAVKLGED
ncbi:FtsX-like permease family protein [Litchfieldia alkalitelluris]|uniref:FtsX-like permease family protein n=1 Tax=Litchfieldia alkalitelluris TaxID=304268 RepID=UPI000996E0E8|nr:FtsX-like permease family protein [Litchfieldia alkalitelluris]